MRLATFPMLMEEGGNPRFPCQGAIGARCPPPPAGCSHGSRSWCTPGSPAHLVSLSIIVSILRYINISRNDSILRYINIIRDVSIQNSINVLNTLIAQNYHHANFRL